MSEADGEDGAVRRLVSRTGRGRRALGLEGAPRSSASFELWSILCIVRPHLGWT